MRPKSPKMDKKVNNTSPSKANKKDLSEKKTPIKMADSKAAKAAASPGKPSRQPSDKLFKELTKIIAEQRHSDRQQHLSSKSTVPKGPMPIRQTSEQTPSLVPKIKHDQNAGNLKSAESSSSVVKHLSLEPERLSFDSKPSFLSKQSVPEIKLSSFESKKTLFEPKSASQLPKQPFVSKRPASVRRPDPKVLSVDKRERKIDIVGIKKPGQKIQKKQVKHGFTRIIRKFREPKFIDQDPKDQKRSCRICFSSQSTKKTGDLIVPCNCRGIFSTVHQRCISDWIVAMCSDTCDICRFKFFISAKHKGLIDFVVEERQFHFIWQTLTIVCFSLYLILIASAFVQVVEHYAFLNDTYTLLYKISCSILIFVLLCYVGYYFAERAVTYREWRKYKYHITVKPNPNYRISEIITPPPDVIRSSGLGQYSIKPLIRPVL